MSKSFLSRIIFLFAILLLFSVVAVIADDPAPSSDNKEADKPSAGTDSPPTPTPLPLSKEDIDKIIESDVYQELELTDPIDGSKVKGFKVKSFYSAGTDSDFCQLYAGQNLYDLWITCSKTTGYCGYPEDFSTSLTPDVKEKINKEIKPFFDFDHIPPWDRYWIVGKIYIWRKKPEFDIGNTYLRATYTMRGLPLGPEERRKEKVLRGLAIKYLRKAETRGQFELKEIANIKYLIGELYRRNEEFGKAIKYLQNSMKIKSRPDWIDKWANQALAKCYAEIAD